MQNLRDQAEARRHEAARKKQEEERAKAAETERVRRQELERGQKLRAELDRKKAERDAQMAVAMKQQAERQQKEVAAAKAKVGRSYPTSVKRGFADMCAGGRGRGQPKTQNGADAHQVCHCQPRQATGAFV